MKFNEQLSALLLKHPAPWHTQKGYGDRGGQFISICDANGVDVIDGESGVMEDEIFEFILRIPEIPVPRCVGCEELLDGASCWCAACSGMPR